MRILSFCTIERFKLQVTLRFYYSQKKVKLPEFFKVFFKSPQERAILICKSVLLTFSYHERGYKRAIYEEWCIQPLYHRYIRRCSICVVFISCCFDNSFWRATALEYLSRSRKFLQNEMRIYKSNITTRRLSLGDPWLLALIWCHEKSFQQVFLSLFGYLSFFCLAQFHGHKLNVYLP